MPLPRLPDFSLDTWIRDQQQQFERTVQGLESSLEFRDAATELESTMPPDFPNPGGPDQWEEADRLAREEEYRRQQEEDERQRRAREDEYRQMQMAQQAQENAYQEERYLNAKMEAAQQDQLAAQQMGLTTPDQAFQEFEAIEQNPQPIREFQDFTAGLEAGLEQPPTPEMESRMTGSMEYLPSPEDVAPSPYYAPKAEYDREGVRRLPEVEPPTRYYPEADRGNVQRPPPGVLYRQPLGNDLEELPSPEDVASTGPMYGPPLSEAGPPLTPEEQTQRDIEERQTANREAVQRAASVAWESAPRAWRPGTEEYERYERDIRRADEGAAQGNIIDTLGGGLIRANRALAGTSELVQGQALNIAGRFAGELVGAPEVGEVVPATKDIPLIGPDLATTNVVEMAAPIVPLPGRAGQIVSGAAGVAAEAVQPVARAAAQVSDDAVRGIRNMIIGGMSDDVIKAAERELAEKHDLTLSQIQALTRESVEGVTGAGAATPSTLPRVNPEVEELQQGYLPGLTPRMPRLSPRAAAQAETDEMMEEAGRVYQLGRERFRLAEIDDLAEQALRQPGLMAELREQARTRPQAEAAIQGRALRMDAEAAAEAARRAAAETKVAQRAVDDWKAREGIDLIEDPVKRAQAMAAMPDEIALAAEDAAYTWRSLMDEFGLVAEGERRRRGQAALEMRSMQRGVQSARAYRQVEKGRSFFTNLLNQADEILGKGDQLTPQDWTKLRRIQEQLSKQGMSTEILDEITGQKVGAIEREAIERVRAQRPARVVGEGAAARGAKAATQGTEAEPTLAELFGRFKRDRGILQEAGENDAARAVQQKIDTLWGEIYKQADERAKQILESAKPKTLSSEEGMRLIDRAVGQRVVSRANREMLARAKKVEGPGQLVHAEGAPPGDWVSEVGRDAYLYQWKEVAALDRAFRKRLDQALTAEKNRGIRAELRAKANDARYMMMRAIDNPDFDPALQEFMDRLEDLRKMPGVGKTTGEKMAGILDDQFLTISQERQFRGAAADEVGMLQSRLRGIGLQLDEALKDRAAPGVGARVRELLQDMREVGEIGKTAADKQKERLFRSGVLEEGKKVADLDREKLIQALDNVRLDDPATIQGVIQAMRNPTWWDKLRESSYVSMLSSPWTLGVNATSNLMQLGGLLFLQNPLQQAYSGGRLSGTGAAFQAVKEAAPEARRMFTQTMRTGMSPSAVERMTEIGDVGAVRREFLSEEPGIRGLLGKAYHSISTRPLEAVDQYLGHLAYAAKVGQAAQTKADKLLRSGAAEVAGMSREEARRHLMQNIWDHPDIMDAAGKVRDYTLLRSRDTSLVENWLRQAAALREPGANPKPHDYARAIVADFIIPFFNVPLNYAKQGLERTVLAPGYAIRGVGRYAKGDVEGAGEDMAKASIGMIGMGLAYERYSNNGLTAGGPDDPGDRTLWLQDHQPYSVKDPLTGRWYSYQGTPFAIPFAIVASVGESVEQAQKRAEGGGREPGTIAMAGIAGGLKGAARGFASQAFLQGITQQVELLTSRDFNLGQFSQAVASAVTRYGSAAGVRGGLPTLSGMSGFLASVGDGMERDAGRPREISEFPENVGARIATRIPGARQQLSERIGAYGEPVRNPRSIEEAGLWPLVPGVGSYHRGRPPRPDDEITRNLQDLGVGRPPAPDSISMGDGIDIKLTIPEQREFDKHYGQSYRMILEKVEELRRQKEEKTGTRPTFDASFYESLRQDARELAELQLLKTISKDDLQQRMRQAIERDLAAPRR